MHFSDVLPLYSIYPHYAHSAILLPCKQNATGITMSVPMPGHPVDAGTEAAALSAATRLEDIILEHDVVFLLTDSRESRWLASLFCAMHEKVNRLFEREIENVF